MASVQTLGRWTVKNPVHGSKQITMSMDQTKQTVVVPMIPISRRSAILISALSLGGGGGLISLPQPALARERRNKKIIPLEDYLTTPADGLKYYDVVEGKGPAAQKGSTVQVHFDCLYRGVTVVSSRESKLLAGNRSIAQASPKPPAAMYLVTEGMKVGGKRIVIVPPEAGYGQRGMNEIPPGATFELNLELLQVMSPEGK
ncbi:peptidyl-prolyl cis-trans isomerase FKBP18, chloroplastic isoform X3 [Camellia sinensis]|uniref:peptidyl-prolyl cis-trans isomerase FKBP18, chloroplastic isoform X3 n=1 Tax=Camellia sinensis TaxID=4442 RepID=UPI00103641A9|nr:peptidyl-prolyl cis-trans isomerase FKBP18, chloroplastic isoform X3 [Camellia sinensis]